MNGMNQDQLVKVLEAVAPDHASRIRAAFGLDASPEVPQLRKGFTFITESDREWHGSEVIELAQAVCPRWSEPNFSAKKWIKAARESVRKLREANPESAFAFLLRKGVQTIANDWYNTTPRDWQGFAGTASSNNFAEWYAPLYASQIAGRVTRGERFPEGRIVGEDSVVVNQKYGLIESFDRELFDDDQTGQIKSRASRLGQSMAITESVYAALRYIGAAASYSNLVVPVSQYTTTDVNGNLVTGPWNVNLYGTGVGNRPVSYAALSLTGLKSAYSGLLLATDPQSNRIIVKPDILLHSPMDALHAPLLVKPPSGVPYYPAVVGAGGQSASTAGSGFPGGVFGANPFMGLGITPVMATFLPNWAWALAEKGKGFLFQERDPLEVIQENPASGQAFDSDAIRFRSRRRFEAEWVGGGSRFGYLGNDGTVAGSF